MQDVHYSLQTQSDWEIQGFSINLMESRKFSLPALMLIEAGFRGFFLFLVFRIKLFTAGFAIAVKIAASNFNPQI